jgi:integrase
LKLLLVTGQRRGELANARKEYIDLDRAVWFMPETKNGTDHYLPLTSMALDLFRLIPEQTRGSDFVLPSPHRQIKSTTIEDRPITERAITRAVANNLDHFGIEHFTPHDLRRTATTRMRKLKIDQNIVDRILNHLPEKMVRTYDQHDYMEEKLQALELWNLELSQIVGAD